MTKIAIASLENSKDSLVSPIGARSQFFLIFDDQGGLIKAIENPFLIGGGAGFGVVSMLAQEGVDVLIAGAFGPNMSQAMIQSGIRGYVVANKTVSQALSELFSGNLQESSFASNTPPGGYGPGSPMARGGGYGQQGQGFGRGMGRGYGRGGGGQGFGRGQGRSGRGFWGRFFGW